MRKLISVCVPTYEMKGKGAAFLAQSFDVLARQTFRDFDVVVSDHSVTDEVKAVCDRYADRLDIKYARNEEKRGNSPANTNSALRRAEGKIAKLLFQDDYLADDRSLERIAEAFDLERDRWLVTACAHTKDGATLYRPFHPRYNDRIHLGKNTISSPSVLAIKNESPLFFDERLVWSMDCDYYKRLHDAYGDPKIVDEICVVNRVGEHQISSTETDQDKKDAEYRYILEKYGEPMVGLRMAWRSWKRRARRAAKKLLRR